MFLTIVALIAGLTLWANPALAQLPPKGLVPPGLREVPGSISPPTSGPDTYVSIGAPFSESFSAKGRTWGVPVTIGNAGNVSAYYIVAKLRVSRLNKLVCEVASDALGIGPGESFWTFGFQVHDSGTRQRDMTFTIDAEVSVSQSTIPRPENTTNNRQVVTLAAPFVGSPRCLKAVSFKKELYPVFAHYRCINCHGRVDPVKGHRHTHAPYAPSVSPPNCHSCHNVDKWTNVGVPVFWNVYSDNLENPGFICNRVKQNVSSREKLHDHLTKDPRMRWAFNPDSHQLAPTGSAPGGHSALVQKMMNWFDQGRPCPML